MQKEIDTLFGEIVKALNIGDLPRESQEKILSDISENILEEIYVSTIEALPEGDRETFINMQDNTSPEEMQKFVTERIENYTEFTQKKAREVVDEFIKVFNNEN